MLFSPRSEIFARGACYSIVTPQKGGILQGLRTMFGRQQSKLVFPGLAGFYASVEPITYAIVRFAIGATVFMHGWGKVTGGAPAAYFAKIGMPAPTAMAYWALFIETIGAACVAIGLFTRFFAAALAIEMLIAMWLVHWANGFLVSVSGGKNGMEYVLILGVVLLAIAIRGGGPYSVDAKLGKEL
jgi:putative oxidoreductase